MSTNLKKIFISVTADKEDDFLNSHLAGYAIPNTAEEGQPSNAKEGLSEADRNKDYDSKICFLQKSNQIFTQGKLFGLNNSGDVAILTALIGTMPNKTNGQGNPGDADYVAPTKYASVVEYIQATAKAAVTSGVSVDTTQFSLVSTAKYQLAQDETGKISIVRYDPVTLSIAGLSTVEIDSTVDAKTITPTVGGSNASIATLTWSVTGGTLNKTSTTGSETVSVSGITSPTGCTVKASATDGSTSANDKSTSLSFAPRTMWGSSANEITEEITDSNTDNYGYALSYKLSNKSIKLTAPGYIYYATSNTPSAFYISGTTSKASLAGGFSEVGTFTKYTSSTKTYKLYRSEKQAAGTYRIDVD